MEGHLERLLGRLLEQEEVKVEVKVEVQVKVEAKVEVEIQAKTHVPTPVATQFKIRSDEQRVLVRETHCPLGAGNTKSQILNPKARADGGLRVASNELREANGGSPGGIC